MTMQPAPSAPTTCLELRNGRLIDILRGEPMPAGVRVIVQGGRIVALPGLEGQPERAAADLVVDLQGRTVIPGLFDTHCHLHSMRFVLLCVLCASAVNARLRLEGHHSRFDNPYGCDTYWTCSMESTALADTSF